MSIVIIKLTNEEVATLLKYYNDANFPLHGIHCDFDQKDADWLYKFYEKCWKKLGLGGFFSLQKYVQKKLGLPNPYTTLASHYGGLKAGAKNAKGTPSLLVLLLLCDETGFDFEKVNKKIKNMHLHQIGKMIPNCGMKIISLLLKEPGLTSGEIRNKLVEQFKDDISMKYKGMNYVSKRCHGFRNYCYLLKNGEGQTAQWYIEGQDFKD